MSCLFGEYAKGERITEGQRKKFRKRELSIFNLFDFIGNVLKCQKFFEQTLIELPIIRDSGLSNESD
jgi:hypothetical protein